MRKLIASILAATLLIATSTFGVSADDYSEYIEAETGYFTGQTSIDYHIYSSYYVTIPTSIGEYDTSGTITVTMNSIEDSHHIEVYITNLDSDGLLEVTSDSGNIEKLNVLHDDGLYTVQNDGLVKEFYPADYQVEANATTNISFAKSGMGNNKAGTYHGTVCFRVECLPD